MQEGIPAQAPSGTVLLARDTRSSGPALAQAAAQVRPTLSSLWALGLRAHEPLLEAVAAECGLPTRTAWPTYTGCICPQVPPLAQCLGLAWQPRCGLECPAQGVSLADSAHAVQGIAAVGAKVEDRGVLTTPQLHWMVRSTNRAEAAAEQDYFYALAAGFRYMLRVKLACAPLLRNTPRPVQILVRGETSCQEGCPAGRTAGQGQQVGSLYWGLGIDTPAQSPQGLPRWASRLHHIGWGLAIFQSCEASPTTPPFFYRELLLLAGVGRSPLAPLLVDGANGVGAAKVERLGALLADTGLAFRVRNSGRPGEGRLNAGCGADFVQKEQAPPAGLTLQELREGRGASLDGDADRVVFYYCDVGGRFKLLDGDKIAALAAGFVNEQLRALGDEGRRWRVGVVQTAYANGAATEYLRSGLQLEVRHSAARHSIAACADQRGYVLTVGVSPL